MTDEHMADEPTLGDIIHDARVAKGDSLRGLAGQLKITPSYLSDIENDRRVPAEEVLRQIAQLLALDFDELMARAGRFGQAAERYMKKHPEAVRLFRRITEANLDPEQLREMIRKIEHQESEDAQ